MPAFAGPAPWYGFKAVQGNTYKSSHQQGSMEWDLSNGWHYQRQEGWKKDLPKHTKTITGLDGKKHKLTTYGDFDDYMGFSAHAPNEEERLAYAEEAFKDEGNVVSVDGVGHIVHLDYAKQEQILRVTFKNGDICLFFRVPHSVAGQLISYAEKRSVAYKERRTGIERHKLGVEFWNLVRIRGQHVGAKYPFEYEKQSNGMYVTHSNDRYTVRVSTADVKEAFGEDFANRLNLKKPNETISLVLSEQELYTLLNELGLFNVFTSDKVDLVGAEGSFYVDPEELKGKSEEEIRQIKEANANLFSSDQAVTADQLTRNREKELADLESRFESSKLVNLVKLLEEDAQQQAMNFLSQREVAEKIGSTADGKTWTLDRLLEYGDPSLKRIINSEKAKGWDGSIDADVIKHVNSFRALREIAHVLNPDLWKTWVSKKLPELRKVAYSGKVWTPEDLENFANASIDGNIGIEHAATYKKFIKNGDYQGALNFLKTHKGKVVLTDKYGKKTTRRQNYASNYDQLGQED